MTGAGIAGSRGWFRVLAICLLGGFAFYEWLLFKRWAVLDHWGALGSALGPIAALFSAGAVFAALRSIELQRAALAGQQEELTKQQAQIERHMKLLEEQREQFTRSADAQQDLTRSQRALARAQDHANLIAGRAAETHEGALRTAQQAVRQARRAELAQRYTNLATFMSAAASIFVTIETGTGEGSRPTVRKSLEGRHLLLDSQVQRELSEIADLERQLREDSDA